MRFAGEIEHHVEQFFGQDFLEFLVRDVKQLSGPCECYPDNQAHVDIQYENGEWFFGVYWPEFPLIPAAFYEEVLTAIHECGHLYPFSTSSENDCRHLLTVPLEEHETFAAFCELKFVSQFQHSYPLLAGALLHRFGPAGHPVPIAEMAISAWRDGWGLSEALDRLLGVSP